MPAVLSRGRGTRWRAALRGRRRRTAGPDWEAAVEETSADERHEARWKARLDTPVDGAVLGPSINVVGGWAVHEWRRLQGVLVTVDGRPQAFVTEFHERRDVARRWADFPTVDRAGWTAEVDLGDTPRTEAVVSAYAFLEPRRRPLLGVPPRLGPVRHIGSARCEVRSDVGPSGLPVGHFLQPDQLAPGYVRVAGMAKATEDVASVELRLDGRPAGPARVTPGLTVGAGSVTITSCRFDGVVEVPAGAGTVSVSATATLVSGRTFELDPWHAEVRAPVSPVVPDATRLALVRDRSVARLAALARGTAQPDEPRVLVATHDLNLGGGQLYLHELMRRLARRGVRFALTSPRSGVLVDELEALGVPVLVTGPTQVADPEAYEAQVADIAAWSVQHGCRSVLANTMTAFAGADAGLRLGLPLVWAVHESYPFGQFWMEAFGAAVAHEYVVERARQSLAAAARVVFEAGSTRDLLEPLLAPGAGVVVPYGVDLLAIERFRDGVDRAALRAELGIRPDALALLCMGTVEPRKGQLGLAQAFARSGPLRGADAQLVFVGAVDGTPDTEDLHDLVAGLDDPRIRVEPVQPDIHRWYHASDVLVCASDVESLPRSMLEAMAFGRPVASTAVFGIPELVTDGESGFLCRDRDLAALRAMLERVAGTGREALAAMGARARDVVTSRHDPAVYERYYADQLVAAVEPAAERG